MKTNWGAAFQIAAVYVGTVVGAGFATGRRLWSFFPIWFYRFNWDFNERLYLYFSRLQINENLCTNKGCILSGIK